MDSGVLHTVRSLQRFLALLFFVRLIKGFLDRRRANRRAIIIMSKYKESMSVLYPGFDTETASNQFQAFVAQSQKLFGILPTGFDHTVATRSGVVSAIPPPGEFSPQKRTLAEVNVKYATPILSLEAYVDLSSTEMDNETQEKDKLILAQYNLASISASDVAFIDLPQDAREKDLIAALAGSIRAKTLSFLNWI